MSGSVGLASSNFEVGVRSILRVSSDSNRFCIENSDGLPHYQLQELFLQRRIRPSSENAVKKSLVPYLVLLRYPGSFAVMNSRTVASNQNFIYSCRELVGMSDGEEAMGRFKHALRDGTEGLRRESFWL